MKFKKRYEEKKFSSQSSLALELGTIAHKGKELVAKAIIDGDEPNYEEIKKIVHKGCEERERGKTKYLTGIDDLKKKYVLEWAALDEKSNLTYEEKLDKYFENLHIQENDKWHPIEVEMSFSFPYRSKYLLTGYIDKIEQDGEGNLRVVDYKTSKKVYDEKDLKTPLQMVIYDLAVQDKYSKIPVEHIYDFIFIGKKQNACTKGYLKRGETKLGKLFSKIEECRETNIYVPNPSPLCHWCDFCRTNKDADDKLKNDCPYYSLWTPQNKTFSVNKEFDGEIEKKTGDFWF